MEFSILGPVEAVNGNAGLPLGGPRQRALLACLLVNANRVVSADSLVDQLWVDPPRDAHAALQNQVSRLRKVLGDRLVTKAPGYLVRVEEGELDLDRFRTLVAQAGATADLRERAGLLREADALFRGPALAQVDAPFAAPEAAALEELRLAAVEARVDAELERGRHAELVPELAALVKRFPLRERLHGQHILALYRCGRQVEALEAYRETRRMLDEGLGLEPGPELRELEVAILRHDPALAQARIEDTVVVAAAPEPARSRRRVVLAVAAALIALAAAGVAAAVLLSSTPAKRATPTIVAAAVQPVAKHRPVAKKRTPVAAKPRRHHAAASVKRTHVVLVRKHVPATTRTQPGATTTHAATTRPATPAPPPVAKPKPKGPTNVTPTVTTVADAPPPAGWRQQVDTFANTTPNWAMWGSGMDPGTSYALQNGRLELTLDGAGQTTGQWDMLNASFFTRCHYDGDFDARVDYTLLTWPQAPGVRVQLSAWFANNLNTDVARKGNQYGEGYDGNLDQSYQSFPSNDTHGTLRVARSGGTLSSYYLEDGKWVLLISGAVQGPAQIGLQLFAMGTEWSHKTTRAALDNFSVAAQTITC